MYTVVVPDLLHEGLSTVPSHVPGQFTNRRSQGTEDRDTSKVEAYLRSCAGARGGKTGDRHNDGGRADQVDGEYAAVSDSPRFKLAEEKQRQAGDDRREDDAPESPPKRNGMRGQPVRNGVGGTVRQKE